MDVLLHIFLFESEDQSMKFSLSPPLLFDWCFRKFSSTWSLDKGQTFPVLLFGLCMKYFAT